jgi:hypothetical protein
MGNAKADDTFVSTERLLSEHQVDFDIVDEDAIGQLLPLEHGSFVSGSGNRYRTVLVPNATLLPESVVARLKSFAAGGGKVVLIGAPPARIGTKTSLNARAAQSSEFSWAAVVDVDLPKVPTPPAQPPTAAPEPMVVPEAAWNAVAHDLPTSALRLAPPSTAVRVMARRLKDATVLLVFNEAAQEFDGELTVAAGKTSHVEAWDAQTATIAPLNSARSAAGRSVHLRLAPYAAQVLVVR